MVGECGNITTRLCRSLCKTGLNSAHSRREILDSYLETRTLLPIILLSLLYNESTTNVNRSDKESTSDITLDTFCTQTPIEFRIVLCYAYVHFALRVLGKT